MNIIGHTLQGLALLANLLAGAGFLFCSYSQYLSPVAHPVLSCAGLFFPFFLFLNALFLLFWLFVQWKFSLVPFLFLLAGWGSIRSYAPWGHKEEAEGKETLKFLTYNVMGMPVEKGDSVNPIVEYIRKSDADVVCLQEYPVHDEKIRKALSFYPYVETFAVAGWNGMACLSRYPILSVERIGYKSVSNGSFLLRLKLDKDTMAVVCNHLESNKLDAHDKQVYEEILKSPGEKNVKSGGKYLLGKLAEAAALRAPQADSVAQAIAGNKCRYMLVCGDFNDSPLSYAHRIIGRGLHDAYIEAGRGPGFSYNRNFLYFRIDHLMVGEGFRVLEADVDNSISASDHYPLWCVVEKL
ncbi:endonuclease/exonuclease/phosphatase family protein [Bacteroides gallinaceum]|uniref:Endonuclease/exonuclease/phosphatase family protein n=1 Tax=Candidatus Phocaeicola excrementipullorum TaxID=2838731 RepID=A0A948X1U4_9BACT|nr:endonuclease/exonuclease/phosphatase family protein [Bacteroides gallinaceum]MBU3855615.1 endonuclease/exonuclease/phosphatase family protein [Candidatus Phocaeicola excrementipullorum]MBW9199530.1 endonuclease [Bacteroidales bacterium SW299]MDM8208076.1 endonuclease/exonuclease/phosphatase family protein [Bacteroides gallinaceum]